MKSWVLSVLAIVALCYIGSSFAEECAAGEGVCLEVYDDSRCNRLRNSCDKGFKCCEKETPAGDIMSRATKRKCQTKKKCSKQGGTCTNDGKGDLCYAFGVDSLCKGSSCSCCLLGKSSCKSTPKCKFQGGVCVASKKADDFCAEGTIDKKGCKGKKCVCCFANEKSCMCGVPNELEPTTVAEPPTTPSAANPPANPKQAASEESEDDDGGTDMKPNHKYPWLVGIEVGGGDSDDFVCAGAIINTRYVVTDAHCLDGASKPKDVTVYVAAYNQSDKDNGVTNAVRVKQIFISDDYPATSSMGLALLRLKTPLDLISNDEIKPVCLPMDEDETYEGDEGVLVGWGTASDDASEIQETPKEVTVGILAPDCQGGSDVGDIDVGTDTLCDDKLGNYTVCARGGGSPLAVEKDGRYVLVGLASNVGCDEEEAPGIYTRVTDFIDWIYDTVSAEGSFCG